MTQLELEECIRRLVRGGRLPGQHPTRIWGGSGSGQSCAVCGERLQKNEMELELQFAAYRDCHTTTFVVHPRCFVAFETQVRANGGSTRVLPAEDVPGTIERDGESFTGPGAK